MAQQLWAGARLMSPLVATSITEVLADADAHDPLMGTILIAPHRRSAFASELKQHIGSVYTTADDAHTPPADSTVDRLFCASVAIVIRASAVLDGRIVASDDPIRLLAAAISDALAPPSPLEPIDRARALILALEAPGPTADALSRAVSALDCPLATKLDAGHVAFATAFGSAASAVAHHLRRYLRLIAHDALVDAGGIGDSCSARLRLLAAAVLARAGSSAET